MVTKISSGVSVTVEVFYQSEYSNPLCIEYMFAYRITIENHNTFAIKLLTRHWYIFDSTGENREVQGDGVVGLQPYIEAGEQFQYSSGCNLRTEMGKMYGTYTMENQNNKMKFKVQIPAFEMIAPSKYN